MLLDRMRPLILSSKARLRGSIGVLASEFSRDASPIPILGVLALLIGMKLHLVQLSTHFDQEI